MFIATAFCAVVGCSLFSSAARAQFTGDAELLNMAAVKFRANMEQLRTWRGRVAFSSRSLEEGTHVLVECSMEFAYDRKSSAYRWTITTEKNVEIIDGKEKPRSIPLGRRLGMFRDGAHYRVLYGLKNEQAPRTVYVQTNNFMRPGYHYGTFDPMYFWTYEGAQLDKYWQMMYDNVDNPKTTGTITRKGDLVVVAQNFSGGVVKGVHELDLSQGCNLTRLETTLFKENQKLRNTVWTWSWEQVGGVWVPKEVAKDHVSSGEHPEEYHKTLKWTENTVNEPLAEDEFSLVKLGLRRGDRVYDTRTDTKYVIEGSEFPPAPGSEPALPPRRTFLPTVLAVLSIIVLLLGLLVWVRRGIGRKRTAK